MTSWWCVVSLLGVIGCGSDDGSRHILDAPNGGGSDASGHPTCPGIFTDDFSQGLRPALWTTSQTTADLFSVMTSNNAVHLAKVMPSAGGLQTVSVILDVGAIAGPVDGDFTLSVDFANAVIGPAEDQVELHPTFADSLVFFDVYSDHGGAGPELHVWDGSTVHDGFPTTATAGTLTIARAATELIGNATIAGSSFPIYAGPGSSSSLTNVSINLQLQPGSDDSTSVDFSNLRLGWSCP
jgi:hypothetical protein